MGNFNKLHFIVNEHSTRGGNMAATIQAKIESYNNVPFQIYKTQKKKDGIDIVAKIAPTIHKNDLIIAAGGDGTLSEVVNGLQYNKLKNPLAFIPTGSGNDFARSVHIPRNSDEAFNHIFEIDGATQLDVLKITENDRVFYAVNNSGAGIDGQVIHAIQSASDKKAHNFTYLFQALIALFKHKSFDFTLTIDGETIEVKDSIIILTGNQGIFGGGIQLHPETNAKDGLVDILYGTNINLFDLFILVPQILFLKNHLKHKKVYTHVGKNIKLELHNEQYAQADGEDLGLKKHKYEYRTTTQNFWI